MKQSRCVTVDWAYCGNRFKMNGCHMKESFEKFGFAVWVFISVGFFVFGFWVLIASWIITGDTLYYYSVERIDSWYKLIMDLFLYWALPIVMAVVNFSFFLLHRKKSVFARTR